MKHTSTRFLIIIILFFSASIFHKSYAQGLTISDLYLIQKSNDIQTANQFLSNYKKFLFAGSLGKTSEGCDVLKWSQDRKSLEITTGSIMFEGKYTPVFNVKYLLPEEDFKYFKDSMENLNLKAQRQGTTKYGEQFAIWSGTDNLADMAKMITTMKKGSFYEIIILN